MGLVREVVARGAKDLGKAVMERMGFVRLGQKVVEKNNTGDHDVPCAFLCCRSPKPKRPKLLLRPTCCYSPR